MTMQAAAYGRIGQDPRRIETRSGKAMATASIAVNIGDGDEPPLWMGVVAFGKVAEELLRHKKGDLVSASGRVQRNSWTAANGDKREQLQIVADAVISSRTVRPSGGKRRDEQSPPPNQPSSMSRDRDLDNRLPF